MKLGCVEIVIEAIDIHSIAETPLPIAADSTLEKQMDWRQVSLGVSTIRDVTLVSRTPNRLLP